MDLGGGLGGAERGGDDAGAVEPGRGRDAMAAGNGPPLARGHHEGVHATVAVVGPELRGQLGVEREARPRQRAERRAVAPVQRQESSGLARRGAGHARALHHGDRDAAAGQEVRHRGAHDARSADDDVTGRSHGLLP